MAVPVRDHDTPAKSSPPASGRVRKRAPRVCLDCRALLLEDERCDCAAEAVAPASPAGWDALSSAAWGRSPPSSPPRGRARGPLSLAAQVSGASFAAVATLVVIFSARATEDVFDRGTTWVLAVVLWLVCSAIATWEIAASREPQVTRSGRAFARGVGWRRTVFEGLAGRVEGETTVVAPLSGQPCLAYSVWICSGDSVLLRDARCAEHVIFTEDGDRVEIAAGRVDVDAPRGLARRYSMRIADEFLLDQRLHPPPALGDADPGEANHPFAGDFGYELILLPGDRVLVASELEVDAGEASPASYRDKMPVRRVPVGAPRIVPLSSHAAADS